MVFRFEELEIWGLAIEYGNNVYKITENYPRSELFGLTSQTRRAAISISNNIAEGSGATTTKDFKCFLDRAIKSALEVISCLFFAQKREYISEENFRHLYRDGEIIIKKTRAFKKSLDRKR